MAKRRAKLTVMEIKHVGIPGPDRWLRLVGRSGEIQLAGESVSNAKRARAACIRSFADVLRAEGWTVEPPEVKP